LEQVKSPVLVDDYRDDDDYDDDEEEEERASTVVKAQFQFFQQVLLLALH
jgi:hypothetical protein